MCDASFGVRHPIGLSHYVPKAVLPHPVGTNTPQLHRLRALRLALPIGRTSRPVRDDTAKIHHVRADAWHQIVLAPVVPPLASPPARGGERSPSGERLQITRR
jgi:hypothetical protein